MASSHSFAKIIGLIFIKCLALRARIPALNQMCDLFGKKPPHLLYEAASIPLTSFVE